MSPEYVRPYVKAQKNDDRDAEGIAEAATRPTMRFVEMKSQEQLDMQTLHSLIREADVFTQLRAWREAGRRFDAIVLDPPKFAQSAGQVERATRAYKDINLLALQLLEPGGILATFSCSGHVSTDLFQKVVFGAMVDAGREAQIVEVLGQAPDHPVHLAFPEAAYLKGLVLRAL